MMRPLRPRCDMGASRSECNRPPTTMAAVVRHCPRATGEVRPARCGRLGVAGHASLRSSVLARGFSPGSWETLGMPTLRYRGTNSPLLESRDGAKWPDRRRPAALQFTIIISAKPGTGTAHCGQHGPDHWRQAVRALVGPRRRGAGQARTNRMPWLAWPLQVRHLLGPG